MMTEIKPKWKECPKCKGFIPETWMEHKKCGWENIQVEKLESAPQAKEAISRSQSTMLIAYCKDLIVAGKVDLSALEYTYKRMVALL